MKTKYKIISLIAFCGALLVIVWQIQLHDTSTTNNVQSSSSSVSSVVTPPSKKTTNTNNDVKEVEDISSKYVVGFQTYNRYIDPNDTEMEKNIKPYMTAKYYNSEFPRNAKSNKCFLRSSCQVGPNTIVYSHKFDDGSYQCLVIIHTSMTFESDKNDVMESDCAFITKCVKENGKWLVDDCRAANLGNLTLSDYKQFS